MLSSCPWTLTKEMKLSFGKAISPETQDEELEHEINHYKNSTDPRRPG
jgi:hypothetical protein